MRTTSKYNRSKIVDKIYSRSSRKSNKNSFRRSRKRVPKNTHREFKFTEEVGKNIIKEIQYSSLVSPILSPERRIFNEEKDHSMEIVDSIVDKRKEPKTVKFEQESEVKGIRKPLKGVSNLIRLKSSKKNPKGLKR